MLLRRTQWAASLLALGISVSVAMAQPPSGIGNSVPPPEELAYSFDNNGNFIDGLDLGPRWRFQADWVNYTRENTAKETSMITGAEPIGLKNTAFDRNSGYRLTLGFMHDDYELEASFFELNGLNGSQSGTLTNAVVFDGATGFAGASIAAQGTIGATPNFLELNTLFSVINTASNHPSGTATENETNELEFLDSGAQYAVRYNSDLQDLDVNLKGRRQEGRLLRFGLGIRSIQFEEGHSAALRGSFNTVDSDGDETPGMNDQNDGLSNVALTANPGAGLTLGSGTGGFFENTLPTQPDQLLFNSTTRSRNLLNGVQGTLDVTFLESEHFSIGGYAKAGVFHNIARGSVTESYRDLQNGLSTYSRTLGARKDRVSFAGNLGITGTILFSDSVRLFGGYELMYLNGVALAPDQANAIVTDISNSTSLNLRSNSDALFHGGRIGLEILFP